MNRTIGAAMAGIALSAGVVLAWHWHGASRYDAGYRQAQADTQAAQAAIERGMQYERDRADAEYRGAVLARQAADRVLADQRKRIDGLLNQLRNRAETAGTSTGADGAGADWIGIFGACVAEYDDMGREAGRLADKVGGLQGYVRGVLRGGDSGN